MTERKAPTTFPLWSDPALSSLVLKLRKLARADAAVEEGLKLYAETTGVSLTPEQFRKHCRKVAIKWRPAMYGKAHSGTSGLTTSSKSVEYQKREVERRRLARASARAQSQAGD